MKKQQTGRGLVQRRQARSRGSVIVAVIVLMLSAGVARGLADESGEPAVPADASLQMAEALLETVPSTSTGEAAEAFSDTDPQAAEELPLEGLGRSEAEDVFSSVFPNALEVPAGIFNGLEVEKFNSDYAAVVAPSESPVEGGQPGLLVSTVPLRTEAEDGSKETVDLGLEPEGGALQPQNPVVEVEMPASLEEGISLPESGVTVSLKDAPERSPSSLEGSAAFYPNVAADTDLSVSPTPTGFETFFDLRSPDSPLTQTLELSVPKGADLEATGDGGVKVMQGGEPLVSVQPPAAFDAEGNPVPVSMQVAGDSLELEVSPAPDASYPILIDPLVQSWNWNGANSPEGLNAEPAQWFASSNNSLFTAPFMGAFGSQYGLNLRSATGTVPAGSLSAWAYYVPRYFTDQNNPEVKEKPTTYIKSMTLSQVYFWLEENPINHWHPYILAGLWDEKGAAVSSLVHNSGEGAYSNVTLPTFTNPNENETVKGFSVILSTSEAQSVARHFLAGAATVEVTDNDSPTFAGSGPGVWMNNTASAIPYTATDRGLGVYELQLSQPLAAGGNKELKTSVGCVGSAASPCPRSVKQTEKTLLYEPSTMPTGEDKVSVTTTDPVAHKSGSVQVNVKVDHTAPTIAPLTGTLTEQATLGTKRPTYTITAASTDGTEAAPQSGIYEAKIEVDGKVVATDPKKCATKNCASTINWTLEASKYTAGEHTLKVTATDVVGLSSTKELKFSLNPSPPALSLSGTMMEQKALGYTRPRYVLKETASAEAGTPGGALSTPPTYSSSFGTSGTGNGQFSHPADVAIDSSGNEWVVDELNNRLEVFNSKGEFLKTIGSLGSGNGQFNKPKSIAFNGKGGAWIADSANNRLQEISESTGAFIKAVGTKGSGNGQFNGPESIAIDAKGNLLVADTYNYRIQKLNENGEFLEVINPAQMGAIEPTGIDAGGGYVWVADWAHNRVVQLTEAGAWVRQFGSLGTGNGQFEHPDTVTVDPWGVVFVGDQNNGRVEEFNQSGEYLTKFGTKGTGAGQFSFAYPFGIAIEANGTVLIADANNNRVQKWTRTMASEIKTETKVDGVKVDSATTSCPTEKCPSTHEWILPSSSYQGKHTVSVTATDGLGNTITKSETIEEKKDETKPTITLSGQLPTAPEGWVEQQPYTFKAEAADPAGYGVTSVSLKIDGSTVASTSGTCPEGTCPLTLSQGVNTGSLSGGAHAAVVTATDGAGNVQTKPWTVNVDPEGHIGIAEAEATLEALDETSATNVVGESEDEEEVAESAPGMSLALEGSELEAEGTGAPVSIGSSADEGLTVETLAQEYLDLGCGSSEEEGPAEEEPKENSPPTYSGDEEEALEATSSVCETEAPLSPVVERVSVVPEVVSETAGSTTVTESGGAAINTNIRASTDLVTRPLYDGAMSFAAIRDESAPEEYSWTVNLEEGQELKSIDSRDAAVYWSDGTVAFGVSATLARDAVGTSVPTTLSVSEGDVVTLTVEHRSASYVYPVVAGAGWEGGFQSVQLVAPPGELPSEEQEEELSEKIIEEGSVNEELESGQFMMRTAAYGAPVFDDDATHRCHHEHEAPCYKRKFLQNECHWIPGVFPPGSSEGPPKAIPPEKRIIQYKEVLRKCHGRKENDEGGYSTVKWAIGVHGKFSYKWGVEVWTGHRPKCPAWHGPGLDKSYAPVEVGCAMEPWKGNHLDALGYFRFHPGKYLPTTAPFSPVCVKLDMGLPVRPLWGGRFIPKYHMSREAVHDNHTPCPWGHMESIF